jgi:geranylgeranyl pyrophosphate synthase
MTDAPGPREAQPIVLAPGASAPGLLRRDDGGSTEALPVGRVRGSGPPLLPQAEAEIVRIAYRDSLPLDGALEPHLRGVLAEVLASPGSLVRAQLAYGMALGTGIGRGQALSLAVAVEYFHTASLLFDDLPIMDDAVYRRGRPCAHRVWGDAAAVLGALALIARAYELLWQVLSGLPPARRERSAALVAGCLGAHGVLDGQARDLHFSAAPPTVRRVLEVAEGKTVSMIRLTLLLPALAGGAAAATVGRLERLSLLWGTAYQVLDDFQDVLLSREESGKSTARDAALARPNLVVAAGGAAALRRLEALLLESAGVLGGSRALLRRYPQLPPIQAFLERETSSVRLRLPARGRAAATRA